MTKSWTLILLTLLLSAILLQCASTAGLVMEPPRANQSLLIGAILLENNGLEDVHEAITDNIYAVIVGRTNVDGSEKTEGYRVKTDENGYFMIPNVPPGAYVLKGIEADLGYETRLLLTSRWDGNTQIFYPIDTIIDFTVRVWPEKSTNRIINMQINYFSIDQASRVNDRRFSNLNNTPLMLKDQTYTMDNPPDYFKARYSESGWFN